MKQSYARLMFLIFFCLFATIVSAATYDMERKVYLPEQNAVYRNLNVLDTLALSTNSGNPWLEIGARPAYFWSTASSFTFHQDQAIYLPEITIQNLEVKGNFISSPTAISISGTVTIKEPYTLYLTKWNDGTASFILNDIKPATTLRMQSSTITVTGTNTDIVNINSLEVRGINVNGVIFPSPRTICNDNNCKPDGSKYLGNDLELVNPNETEGESIPDNKAYYGPWDISDDGVEGCASTDNACDEENDKGSVFYCKATGTAKTCTDYLEPKLAGYEKNNGLVSSVFKEWELFGTNYDECDVNSNVIVQEPMSYYDSNGVRISTENTSALNLVAFENTNPCLSLLGNTPNTTETKRYRRSNEIVQRIIGEKGRSAWPKAEGVYCKNKWQSQEYLIGQCSPIKINETEIKKYEPNYDKDYYDGTFIRIANSAPIGPTLCIKRTVKCASLPTKSTVVNTYKPLSLLYYLE